MPTRVLLALDPTDDLDALREVLVSMGYEVVVAKAAQTVDLDTLKLKVEMILGEET